MKKNLSYGFLIWLIPFIVSFFIFPIHQSNRALFDTVMAVVLVTTTLFFTQKLFHDDTDGNYARDGFTIGLIWAAINLGLDALVFLAPTPLQMSLTDYISDIGLMYVIIPLTTFTVGSMLSEKDSGHPQAKHS